MKKIILGIAIIAAAMISIPAFAAQENLANNVATEIISDEFVQVDFENLPAEIQETLVKEFAGYDIKAVYLHVDTQLLKVIVVKDEEEKTFVQNEEGNFVEFVEE